jgi:SAM-dependent methyltransferase
MLLTVDLERLRLRPGEKLLDAGCGEGRHCFGALERGARVVGLDLDRPSLEAAARPLRTRAAELGSLGVMLQGNAFHLPFRDESFDKVICSEVMEHVHDYRAAARELARVTKPDGMVAVTIPTATSENLYLRLGDEYFESPGGHIRIFKPRDLARALADAGLATVGCGFAHGFHTPYWVLRSAMHLPDADRSAMVRWLVRVEGWLNWICPKSLILYAEKRGKAPLPSAPGPLPSAPAVA